MAYILADPQAVARVRIEGVLRALTAALAHLGEVDESIYAEAERLPKG